MQCELGRLKQSLLSELECPVCMEYMVPPIILCANGHNICNICKPKMQQCPTCRKQFLNATNVALEKLARDVNYPCSYQKYGCVEVFVHDTVREHQERCHYRPQKCPVNELLNVKCDWTGIYQDVKEHLMEKHRGSCSEYVDGKFVTLNKISVCSNDYQFVLALNEVFFVSLQVNNDNNFYTVMQYIGPAENATNYQYKFTFVNKDNTEGVTVMHLTRSFHENFDDIIRSGRCGKLHYDVVSRLETKDVGMQFKMEIFRVGG